MSRRLLVLLALLGGGSVALGMGLRALAQSTPPPAGASTQASTPAQPAATTPAATTPAAAEDEPELRQSADNNISFPVDI